MGEEGLARPKELPNETAMSTSVAHNVAQNNSFPSSMHVRVELHARILELLHAHEIPIHHALDTAIQKLIGDIIQ